MDKFGNELQGQFRRFHTLDSLGLASWAEADARHLDLILDTFKSYFLCNPYDSWFKKLDFVIAGASASYYDSSSSACHLDLVPFATVRKWTELSSHQHSILLSLAGDTLGTILRDSQIRILILNGSSVVKSFQSMADSRLQAEEVNSWSLATRSKRPVKGVSYTGVVNSVAGINLDRELIVLGFNHNLQSSFGVSTETTSAIREWVAQTAEEVIC